MKRFDSREWVFADEALWALDPDTSDTVIANAVAERCLAGKTPPYYLFVNHDERPSTLRRIQKMERMIPNYADQFRVGHGLAIGGFPLRYRENLAPRVGQYWQRKNLVGIKEYDREAAKQWIIESMLLGYAVFHGWRMDGNGFSAGSLAEVRDRIREKQERVSKRTEKLREMEVSK